MSYHSFPFLQVNRDFDNKKTTRHPDFNSRLFFVSQNSPACIRLK
jgi:hypothetical protein